MEVQPPWSVWRPELPLVLLLLERFVPSLVLPFLE
jgi:hypothetical protein